MKNALGKIIEESINLELNVSELYLCFSGIFEGDKEFWWELALEEKNHATMIRFAQETFAKTDLFPNDLLFYNLRDLEEMNTMLISLIKQYKEAPPLRLEAFAVALEIEESSGELHYQRFMEKDEESQIISIFHQLNQYDRDHYLRIQAYMQTERIELYQDQTVEV